MANKKQIIIGAGQDTARPAPKKIQNKGDEMENMKDAQSVSIFLTNKFPELSGQRREDLASAFSQAVEWGRNDAKIKTPCKHWYNIDLKNLNQPAQNRCNHPDAGTW